MIKPFLLAVDRPEGKFNTHLLRQVQNLLGPSACPFMAWNKGFSLGFMSDQPAQKLCDEVKQIVGDETRISVLELGSDLAQYGMSHHNEWLRQLRQLSKMNIGS